MRGYVALWHGGSSYSMGEWAIDAFHVETIADAVEYLRSTRYGRTHAAHAVEWDQDPDTGEITPRVGARLDSVGTPCVDAGATIILAPMGNADPVVLECEGVYGGASHILTLGPRGGIKVERI